MGMVSKGKLFFAFALASVIFGSTATKATVSCVPTGFFRDAINMTAALVNPPTFSGTLDATGCNIAIYYGPGSYGLVTNADIFGANYFGVMVNGDADDVSVDILSSSIHDIGEAPHNGAQHGVAIYLRGFFPQGGVTSRIVGNTVAGYQKGGIVANGTSVQAHITDNVVTGDGHVTFIAMNGIQVGYGATASVMRNTVSGNSYIGFPGDGSASGGVIVVGGPGYGVCPDGNPCPYTVNAKVTDNLLNDNDVGVYLSNLAADYSAPATATNNKAVNNTITSDLCYNASYQAGVSDVGNNDKIINNKISGPGYIGCSTLYNPTMATVDADTSFTNRPKVHANK